MYIYIHESTALPSALCITFPQMKPYIKYFDKNNKCMNLFVNDKKNIRKIWNKIKKIFQKESESEPVYNDTYINAKINLYDTNFYGNKAPIEGEHYTCFFVILIDFFVNVDNKCHLQRFLKESKYAVKKKNMMNTINDELKLNESDDDE